MNKDVDGFELIPERVMMELEILESFLGEEIKIVRTQMDSVHVSIDMSIDNLLLKAYFAQGENTEEQYVIRQREIPNVIVPLYDVYGKCQNFYTSFFGEPHIRRLEDIVALWLSGEEDEDE